MAAPDFAALNAGYALLRANRALTRGEFTNLAFGRTELLYF